MTLRVSHINSNVTTLVNDYDHSFIMRRAIDNTSGVLFSDLDTKPEFNLNTTTGEVSIGECVVVGTRTSSQPIANQKMVLRVNLFAAETVALTVGNKIYIEINDSLLQDQTLIEDSGTSTDYALGKNIAELKSTAAYPSHPNYIPLWEITTGPIYTDVRAPVRIGDKAINLPLNQDFIDLSTDVSDNTAQITALTGGGSIASFVYGEDITEGEQTVLDIKNDIEDGDIVDITRGGATTINSGTRGVQFTADEDFTISEFTVLTPSLGGGEITCVVKVNAATQFTEASGLIAQNVPRKFYPNVAVVRGDVVRIEGTITAASFNSYTTAPTSTYGMTNTLSLISSHNIAYNITFDGISKKESYSIGELSTRESLAPSFVGGGATVDGVSLVLSKDGTPIDNTTVRIETDILGAPSGTLADANATQTFSSAVITARQNYKVVFPGTFVLAENTVYHIVISRSGVVDGSNYLNLWYRDDITTTRTSKQYNGSAWSDVATQYNTYGAWYNSTTIVDGQVKDIVSKSDATYSYKIEHLGQTGETKTKGESGNIIVGGLAAQTGLTSGSTYYLSDTPGAISTSAGSNSRKVSKALSDTTMRIQFPPL